MGNGNVKDFKLPPGLANVPIVGQPEIPAVVLDTHGRPLQTGDIVYLVAGPLQPWRVVSITKADPSRLPPHLAGHPHMDIRFEAAAGFLAPCAMPQQEFARALSRQEVDARREGRKAAAESVAEPGTAAEAGVDDPGVDQ